MTMPVKIKADRGERRGQMGRDNTITKQLKITHEYTICAKKISINHRQIYIQLNRTAAQQLKSQTQP